MPSFSEYRKVASGYLCWKEAMEILPLPLKQRYLPRRKSTLMARLLSFHSLLLSISPSLPPSSGYFSKAGAPYYLLPAPIPGWLH